MSIALALLLFLGSEATPEPRYELEFECKIRVRERVWGRRVELDQWAGARLAMARDQSDGADTFALREIFESPWTLRWYPTKDELKLGSEVHVATPQGDPYGALAPTLEPLAKKKRALWWDDPFFAPRKRPAAPPLSEHPTYPFHVLGPLENQFVVTFRSNAVEVEQRMTDRFLADGWQRAQRGESVDGYGYWDRKQPHWEPNLYRALAVAHQLWSGDDDEAQEVLADLIGILQPRAAGRLDDPSLRIERKRGEHELEITLIDPDDRTRVWLRWRYSELNRSGSDATDASISSRTRR